MKGKVTWEPKSVNRGEFHLRGYFDCNGSSNPTTYVGGQVASVARTASGVFKVTFNTVAKRIIGHKLSFGHNTPDVYVGCLDLNGSDITATSATGADAGYVLLAVFDNANAAYETAGLRVFFDIVCQDYAVQP
jgi:hypothetical protein